MKLAIIGGTGNAGSRIVNEALARGHDVTVVARHPEKATARPRLRLTYGDVSRPNELAQVLAGHDAVISAVAFLQGPPDAIVAAVRQSNVRRYLVVGGAGSLEIGNGKTVLDMPDFPDFAREEATKGKAFLAYLRTVPDLDWTFLSPSALFKAGQRTGKFRIGDDHLLVGEDGQSTISYEDFAVAMLDEVESPRHVGCRFTVGY